MQFKVGMMEWAGICGVGRGAESDETRFSAIPTAQREADDTRPG